MGSIFPGIFFQFLASGIGICLPVIGIAGEQFTDLCLGKLTVLKYRSVLHLQAFNRLCIGLYIVLCFGLHLLGIDLGSIKGFLLLEEFVDLFLQPFNVSL